MCWMETATCVRRHVGARDHELVTRGIPAHPVKGLLMVNDWDKATEIFTNRTGSYENWGELFKLIPRDALGRPHVSRGGHVDQIPVKRLTEFGGGESVLYVDTVESYKHANMSARVLATGTSFTSTNRVPGPCSSRTNAGLWTGTANFG